MIFTANLQIYPHITFLEFYFLDPKVCLLFGISDTLYQIALPKSCTNVYSYHQCMSIFTSSLSNQSDVTCFVTCANLVDQKRYLI